jgi:catechol 2,3-dioxygenase-like lactoylglutathione lyase family enzyme
MVTEQVPPIQLAEIILEALRKSMENSTCSHPADHRERLAMIESISAVTLATHNMPRAVRFYRVLGFEIVHGDDNAAFTSFRAGASYLNLIAQPAERHWSWWGRVIFYHSDVDALYRRVIVAGYQPDTAPRDAEWGERFFHLTDPDGHELSFAWPLGS